MKQALMTVAAFVILWPIIVLWVLIEEVFDAIKRKLHKRKEAKHG